MPAILCPKCKSKMELGYLAFYDPTLLTRIIWQKAKPGYIRFKAPPGSVKVMSPPSFGKEDTQGYICKKCKWVSFQHQDLKTQNKRVRKMWFAWLIWALCIVSFVYFIFLQN